MTVHMLRTFIHSFVYVAIVLAALCAVVNIGNEECSYTRLKTSERGTHVEVWVVHILCRSHMPFIGREPL